MAQVAWTPPGSIMGMGTVLFPSQPTKPVTRTMYLMELADRIDRMIAREDPEWAMRLLDRVELEERLIPAAGGNLGQAGMVIAENSNWLREKIGPIDFPIPPDQIEHDPETMEGMEEEMLEEFLGNLYHCFQYDDSDAVFDDARDEQFGKEDAAPADDFNTVSDDAPDQHFGNEGSAPVDDFDAIFDAVMDDVFGKEETASAPTLPTTTTPGAPTAATESPTSTAKNVTMSLDEAVAGLTALFCGNDPTR
jgi:hypothetical protein